MHSPDDEATQTSVEAIASSFAARLRRGAASIEDELAGVQPAVRATLLEELVAIELRHRIAAGDPARLEEYLDRFPELGNSESVSRALVGAELAARRGAGEPLQWEDLADRFPLLANRPSKSAEPTSVPPEIPSEEDGGVITDLPAGTQLGDFRLLRRLGSGRYAHVYLAQQGSLQREVVLKISSPLGDEGRALARLEHPNIVTVFDQQIIDGRKLLVMKYVAGRTLADWIGERRGQEPGRGWRGSRLQQWVAESTLPGAIRQDDESGFAQRGFAAAMASIGLDIARALRHAHRHGVLHRDIKPANILLDGAGRALLMDFNVSSWRPEDSAASRQVQAGTPAYMAPEQLAAVFSDSALEGSVDHRCDIYSLGIVLFELISGRYPWTQSPQGDESSQLRQMLAVRLQPPPPLPATSPRIPVGLAAIVLRCLAPQLDDRYGTADELVEDLQSFLEYAPLRHVKNPSWWERSRNFGHRHPVLRGVLGGLLVLGITGAAWSGWSDVRSLDRAERAIQKMEDEADRVDNEPRIEEGYRQASHLLQRSPILIPGSWLEPRRSSAQQRLDSLMSRHSVTQLLHFQKLTDLQRGQLGDPDQPLMIDPLTIFRVQENEHWESRPQYQALPAAARYSVCEDVTELLLLRADGMRQRGGEPPLGASSLLDHLPALHRNLAVVDAYQKQWRANPERPVALDELQSVAASEFEFYLVGVLATQRRMYDAALEQLEQALQARAPNRAPRFWTRFHHAFCCQKTGRLEDAAVGYGICIGLRSDFAWPHYNLGLVHTEQGRYPAAIQQLREAVSLAPKLGAAHAGLGTALFQDQQFTAALGPLNQAIQLGHRTPACYTNRAAVQQALGNLHAARADLQRALQIDPEFAPALENQRRLEQSPEALR